MYLVDILLTKKSFVSTFCSKPIRFQLLFQDEKLSDAQITAFAAILFFRNEQLGTKGNFDHSKSVSAHMSQLKIVFPIASSMVYWIITKQCELISANFFQYQVFVMPSSDDNLILKYEKNLSLTYAIVACKVSFVMFRV